MGVKMEAYIITFLKKFVASLYLAGVDSIPFSGKEFQEGIAKMQVSLKENLSEQEYEMISDIFIKTPVQEMYNRVRDLLMSLNGDTISFIGVDNPYWTHATIKMNPYYANKILQNQDICGIKSEIVREATKEFCEAAGVLVWEKF